MISSLRGIVAEKSQKMLIIEVGGVGLKVFAPNDTLLIAKKSDPISLQTYLAVRENALELYGFADKESLEYFELLINISGIGPKTAIAILNVANPETIRKAVSASDTAYLTKVSGIGKKTADKIVRELEDKIGAIEGFVTMDVEVDSVEALKSLGYSTAEARDALQKIDKKIIDTGERVKAALKVLGK